MTVKSSSKPTDKSCDLLVIGAGFGGIATALRASELGLSVVLVERLKYPGGCASTFTHRGFSFEAGATLFSGFDDGFLFDRWIKNYNLDVHVDQHDNLVEFRTDAFKLAIGADRAPYVTQLLALAGDKRKNVQAFLDHQGKIADILWETMRNSDHLYPFGNALAGHSLKLLRYVPALLRDRTKTVADVMKRFDVYDVAPLRHYLNGLCQITVQANIERANALFAFGTMDYYFRGTGHVRGGIGVLADALLDACRSNGVEVVLTNEAKTVQRQDDGSYDVRTRRRNYIAKHVAYNTLPQATKRITAIETNTKLNAAAKQIESGWSACMIYATTSNPNLRSDAFHLQLVGDTSAAFQDGNHVFCSVCSFDEAKNRTPDGSRTITMSTHVALPDGEMSAASVDAVHEKMRDTVSRRAPELFIGRTFETTASPRTFERFTGRTGGYVGGIPKTEPISAGDIFPFQFAPNQYLVGDTAFPGQSTLACALGGVKTAELIAK